MDVLFTLAGYLVIINIAGFAAMKIDKKRAYKRMYRIPEAVFFVLALALGSLGTTLGMFAFRHKTRHWYFLFGMPAILCLQLFLFGLLLSSERLVFIIL